MCYYPIYLSKNALRVLKIIKIEYVMYSKCYIVYELSKENKEYIMYPLSERSEYMVAFVEHK